MVKYRVLYYTAQGIRSKDFDAQEDADAFYQRNIKKHPEYQNRQWSKTEIVTITIK